MQRVRKPTPKRASPFKGVKCYARVNAAIQRVKMHEEFHPMWVELLF